MLQTKKKKKAFPIQSFTAYYELLALQNGKEKGNSLKYLSIYTQKSNIATKRQKHESRKKQEPTYGPPGERAAN